jgi:hypothetical protein
MNLEGVKTGDELLLFDRNTRNHEPRIVTVARIGRTLLYIPVDERFPGGKTLAYRIDTGHRNDDYRHTWLRTRADYEEGEQRAYLITRLAQLGLSVDRTRLVVHSLPRLRALIKVMEDESL